MRQQCQPSTDGSTGKIKYKGKYRTRSEFGEMLDEMSVDKDDAPGVDDKTRWEQAFSQGSESNGKFLAPQRKLANEKPQGQTVGYAELLKSWEDARK